MVASSGAKSASNHAPVASSEQPPSPPSLLSPVIPQLVCVSGLHTHQRMIGCELLKDGSTTGFLQYANDGQDFIVFNKDTLF